MKKLLTALLLICLLAAPTSRAADITITAASVAFTSGQKSSGTAGGTITAGAPLYIDANGLLQLAKGDTAAHAACVGIALNGASNGQPLFYQTSGVITYNAGFTKGLIYVVAADNAGAIAPSADLSSGNYVTTLGVALSTTQLQLAINVSGINQ